MGFFANRVYTENDGMEKALILFQTWLFLVYMFSFDGCSYLSEQTIETNRDGNLHLHSWNLNSDRCKIGMNTKHYIMVWKKSFEKWLVWLSTVDGFENPVYYTS